MVNDLIIKKRFRPDFKKIILDENLNNFDKINLLNDEYRSIFEEMEDVFDEMMLTMVNGKEDNVGAENFLPDKIVGAKNFLPNEIVGAIPCGCPEKNTKTEKLKKLVDLSKNRVDLYFDAMKPLHSKGNYNVITFLKALKYLNQPEYRELQIEIENSIKSGIKYLTEKTKEI
ncbi:MAG: hypothetical protein LBQ59_05175 [Candidatus Peribacteria bacterium]|nr:hypothetical protein [Candidatus Peribacteria bacterium]